jgi:hypothetical protein
VSCATYTGQSTRTGRSDVLVSAHRDAATARRFFKRALSRLKVTPCEVVTDAAPIYPAVLEELLPSAWHHVEQHANNPIEADHSQLKHRLRPMRGLRTDRTAQVIMAGHAFIQTCAEATTNSRSMYHVPNGSPQRGGPCGRDDGRQYLGIDLQAPHQGLTPTSNPPCVQYALRHPQGPTRCRQAQSQGLAGVQVSKSAHIDLATKANPAVRSRPSMGSPAREWKHSLVHVCMGVDR